MLQAIFFLLNFASLRCNKANPVIKTLKTTFANDSKQRNKKNDVLEFFIFFAHLAAIFHFNSFFCLKLGRKQ